MKAFTTKESWRAGQTGKLWQDNFYDHIVRRNESGARIAEYVLMNPVRKGLVDRAEDFPFSGIPDPL